MRALFLLLLVMSLPTVAEARVYPPLFGSHEFANKGIKKFPKWFDMLSRWQGSALWATPFQFLKMEGDCEDYAIAKFMALKALGIPIEDMRVLALRDMNLDIGHAVLIVYDGDTALLLDNQIKSVVPADTVKHYMPIFSLSETGWWLHRR
ncbi:MAG: transglutaminase-like cysteine peptidase [Rhodospirillaceae bacterium]|nr:transglutaminase-like cysteine peptidase [Rhodospirillaceae bacterium]